MHYLFLYITSRSSLVSIRLVLSCANGRHGLTVAATMSIGEWYFGAPAKRKMETSNPSNTLRGRPFNGLELASSATYQY
ncbi:hypothetical protein EV361DRAFT_357466 [Lentinula raphanica]|nr:hypothetical protein EV361DRAFT_357466 [Lentinula raphanica]